ncbi:MAG TPA: hypothetical protein VFC47_15495 [Caulobacteraceae bacterium]|nr:hypothetical protein [Caulobacteraceae bacterium]
MRISKSIFVKSALAAITAAAMVAASGAAAQTKTSIVCNKWDECWKVREHYTDYPADAAITWHDEAWYDAHQHDAHWHWLNDPADDHGWYDKDGTWHAFSDMPHHEP